MSPLRPGPRIEFPIFTYERLWDRLASVIDPDTALNVSRDSGWERVHVAGKLIAQERSDYWIYRMGVNEYGIDEHVHLSDWVQHSASAGSAGAPS